MKIKTIKLALQWLAAATLVIAYRLFRGIHLPMAPLALAIEGGTKTIDEQILESLTGMNKRLAQLEEIEKAVKKNQADYDAVTTLVAEVKKEMNEARRRQIEIKSDLHGRVDIHRANPVSQECAKHLGALGILSILRTPGAEISLEQKEFGLRRASEILGIEAKAALTTTDIPLPTLYSGDIVELVYQYGQARQLCTVYPMGAGTTKLPKLTTDPTWGLIAMSGTVTEKSPQIGFVTFIAEKFGGLIRLPSEIDEDSIVAMGQFIARYSARNLARVEDTQAFLSTGADTGINGAGKGLCQTVVDDGILITQAATKTSQSNATLQNFRDLRSASGISGAVLNNSCYMVHPTYEALFASFNTSATVTPYQRGTLPNGQGATLDGFPIKWVSVMPAYSLAAAPSLVHALFGDATFQYLGVRGGVRYDTSREAAFATDEILIRCLERITTQKMATNPVAGLQTAAA